MHAFQRTMEISFHNDELQCVHRLDPTVHEECVMRMPHHIDES